MDPNIMKLLEEDEDETMHSGADVDAFTAALNRDIEGDNSTQPSDSDSGAISHGSSNTSREFLSQWQLSSNNENASFQNQQDPEGSRQQEQHSSEVELKKHVSGTDDPQQHDNSSQGFTHPPLQHEPSSSQQLQAGQDHIQVSQPITLPSSEKQKTHGHEPVGAGSKKSEPENLKLPSMNNQPAQPKGISNQPASAMGMNNQQAIATRGGDHQPMATTMSNQQSMGTGVNGQQLVRLGMNHQQSMASGLSHPQSMSSGISNQQSVASGMSNQQSMASGMSHPQSMASGMSHQQPIASGMSHQQSMASGIINQQPMASGMSNQQSVASGVSNQQSVATGMSNQHSMAMGMSTHQSVVTRMSNQQAMAAGMSGQHAMGTGVSNQQPINASNRGKQVPFALLLPVIQPQLDKDRGMQLQTLYQKLKKNEISKDGFVRHMRNIVGDHMLKMAVFKLQTQGSQNSRTVPSQQHMQVPANEVPNASAHQQREVDLQGESRGLQGSQLSSSSLNASNQERDRPAFPVQGLNKQQQHLQYPQASLTTFGSTGSNYHLFPTSNASTSAASLKQQTHDSQVRHVPHQSMSATQLGTTPQAISMGNASKFDRQNAFNEPKRMQGGNLAHMANNSQLQQNTVHWHSSNINEHRNGVPSSMSYVKQEPGDQLNDQQQRSQLSAPQGLSSLPSVHLDPGNANPGTLKEEALDMQSSRLGFSTPTSIVPSNSTSVTSTQMDQNHPLNSRTSPAPSALMPTSNAKNPVKKPSVGQKKPLEALGSSPPPSSKKQKVSGAFSDQSIEQLNDVTAVSGVNLREEEEQLFSGTKDDGRVSEASRRVVQEEEERLILQKNPLQKKLAEIMVKCGLKGVGNDVEKCLSLCVEERMRGLISNLIRLSKQRVDIEKPRHRTVITSDVRQQILSINRKAREEWEKKQSEAEKLQRLNDPEGSEALDGDREKDENRARSLKVNKEEDSKTRTTAANVAARAAFGGDDMLSKWQLMAEQARQKREGGTETSTSGSQTGKDGTRKPSSTSGKSAGDHQAAEKRGHLSTNPGGIRKIGRNQMIVPQNRVARIISVKDVIAVLEREPQMSKSTLMYRLYEKIRSDTTTE